MNFPLCRYAPVTTSVPTNVTVLCRRNAVPGIPLVRQLRPCLMLTKHSATCLKIYAKIEVYAYDKILQAISDISGASYPKEILKHFS